MPESRKEFNEALERALAALAQSPAMTDIALDECPTPTALLAHVRGTSANRQVAEHLTQCKACGDLAETMKARQSIHDRQRTAFQEVLNARPSASEEEWKVQRESSFGQLVKQALQPFNWLSRPVGWAVEAGIALAIAAFSFFLWHQPAPEPLIVNTVPTSVKFKAAVEQIQASDAHEPGSVERALRELQKQGLDVSQIDPNQIEQARLDVAGKKVAVTNSPELLTRWAEVEGQLTGLQWINQYASMREKVKGTSVAPEKVWVISGTDGKLTARLGWDPTVNPEDLNLLKDSVRQTPGLDELTLVTPDNKTLTLDAAK